MRKIRFRAWNRKRQSMSYDDIYPEASQDWDLWEQSLHCMLHAVEADHVLMQFTGLLDTNGKEIYEGDILNCMRMTDTTIGYYDEDPDTGDAVARHLVEWDSRFAWFTIPDQIEFWEVIGNIYENPELLSNP